MWPMRCPPISSTNTGMVSTSAIQKRWLMSASSGLGTAVGSHMQRLQRHAADRAGTGADMPDFRVHGAGIDRVGRAGRGRCGDRRRRAQIFRWIGDELRPAAGAAKGMFMAVMHRMMRARRGIDGHAADGIDRARAILGLCRGLMMMPVMSPVRVLIHRCHSLSPSSRAQYGQPAPVSLWAAASGWRIRDGSPESAMICLSSTFGGMGRPGVKWGTFHAGSGQTEANGAHVGNLSARPQPLSHVQPGSAPAESGRRGHLRLAHQARRPRLRHWLQSWPEAEIFLGLGARVVALEPNPNCHVVLERQFGTNSRFELVGKAVAPRRARRS